MRTDACNFLRTNVQKEWIISYFCVRCLKHKKNMNRQEIPVLLLTGYLGSGKTTLVNRILSNEKGIRFAVIVNDIGEVNIDADLIQRGGVVGTQDDSLVALQNGCICCTLKTDLMNQITELIQMRRFDYIVIEASGICEPEPIARTICTMPGMDPRLEDCGIFPRLDCIVTVVDALRLQDEFACGDSLMRENLDEEDIENLILQQIEFCNIVLLNKASEVTPDERARIRHIIASVQPSARILECDYGEIDLSLILNTRMFSFNQVAASAGWVRGIEAVPTEEEEAEARGHEHHHHHHDHDHEEGEAEEYGIGTFHLLFYPGSGHVLHVRAGGTAEAAQGGGSVVCHRPGGRAGAAQGPGSRFRPRLGRVLRRPHAEDSVHRPAHGRGTDQAGSGLLSGHCCGDFRHIICFVS